MPSIPRRDKGVYVELPPDLLKAFDRRCRESGWTRRAEIIMAMRAWLAQPIVANPTKGQK